MLQRPSRNAWPRGGRSLGLGVRWFGYGTRRHLVAAMAIRSSAAVAVGERQGAGRIWIGVRRASPHVGFRLALGRSSCQPRLGDASVPIGRNYPVRAGLRAGPSPTLNPGRRGRLSAAEAPRTWRNFNAFSGHIRDTSPICELPLAWRICLCSGPFRWAGQDSNLGPTDYESAALTN
jgi:hypothetical protein